MRNLRDFGLKLAVRLALRKIGPERYTPQHSGIRANNNFSYVFLSFPESLNREYFRISSTNSDKGVFGILIGPDHKAEEIEICIPWHRTADYCVKVRRVLGCYEKDFSNTFNFITCEILQLPRLIHAYIAVIRPVRQRFFNIGFKAHTDRMKILSLVVDHHRKEFHSDPWSGFFESGYSCHDLFSRLYTNWAFGHPSVDAHLKDFQFILDSLVASGDLRSGESGKYCVEPRAMQTLAEEHKEKQRYNRQMRYNAILVFATVVIALNSFVRIPPWIDPFVAEVADTIEELKRFLP